MMDVVGTQICRCCRHVKLWLSAAEKGAAGRPPSCDPPSCPSLSVTMTQAQDCLLPPRVCVLYWEVEGYMMLLDQRVLLLLCVCSLHYTANQGRVNDSSQDSVVVLECMYGLGAAAAAVALLVDVEEMLTAGAYVQPVKPCPK